MCKIVFMQKYKKVKYLTFRFFEQPLDKSP